MSQEIERKFLIKSECLSKAKSLSYKAERILQAYICTSPGRTVRVRSKGDRCYLTIKGRSSENGLSRFEWEKEITHEDMQQLMELSQDGIIDKTRYLIEYSDHLFELDEFHGDNEGLVVVEVELKSEDEYFEKPSWLGEEVTGYAKYYNSNLRKYPFKSWE